ncbi:MAG TPA: hypothetical protein DEO94_03615 [Cyanobacteria bacterium UBA11991]|nr:hypothetical protein [Cyanobacteriota bacterium]MDY6383617.1 hypothetical protein [Cyanobacteriota bacterium]HCB11226.1 hypothetical protein [Cyanobacteria bacterium UBA11991]
MGFLLGAYGKLAAGSRYRSLQARMMRIQSKLRRASRDVANMEKMIDRQQKNMEQGLTLQNSTAKQMYQATMYTAMQNDPTYAAAMKVIQDNKGSTENNTSISDASTKISTIQAQFQQQISAMNSYADTTTAMNKQQIENYIEQMRDQMLEPLKDEEDSLQLEKDTLESQIQVAKQDYEACQKMEQSDAKMLAPNYTGGQG